jgi:hypothetical protein
VFAALSHSVGHRGFRFALVAVDGHRTKSSRPELFRRLIDCMPFS